MITKKKEDLPIHIKFRNSQNPSATFDLLKLKDLFSRAYVDHSPYDLHLVEFYIILFIEKGKGKHTIDFKTYDYNEGSVLTIRKDQIHRFHKNDSVVGSALLCTDDFLISYLEKLEALKSLHLFNEVLADPKIQLSKTVATEVSEIIQRISLEYFKVQDAYSLGIIRSELHILITKLYRIKFKRSNLSDDKKYLSEFISLQNLVEEKVTTTNKVKDYAQMLGVSTKTLNNICRAIVNKTAKEFIDDICTNQIKRLLINTSLSIKEIAYATGFEETTNFYKYFKRQLNLTPEQFRTGTK